MHDPMTVAFEIKYPWKRRTKTGGYRESFITIWHVDPCKDGSDDSCGWFKRARHGDPAIINKIIDRFEFEWDRIFVSENAIYSCGLFKSNGDPNLSVIGIVLNLFFLAAGVFFESDGRTNWKRARRFMNKNLFDIILFAENTSDSLFDGITRKFEKGCGEEQNADKRKQRIQRMAGCVYGWILREQQRWYSHPRWHFWHWEIQIRPLLTFKRWAFSRCRHCGKGFRWGEEVIGYSWDGKGPGWFRNTENISHLECDRKRERPALGVTSPAV